MRQLHDGAQRHLPQMRHLRLDQRVLVGPGQMAGITFDRERWLEKSADGTRCQMFAYDVLPIDLVTALARLSDLAVTPRASYKVLPPGSMRFDEAFTDSSTNTIYLSEATMSWLSQGVPHSRFTLAHEIGHLVLNHPGQILSSRRHRRSDRGWCSRRREARSGSRLLGGGISDAAQTSAS